MIDIAYFVVLLVFGVVFLFILSHIADSYRAYVKHWRRMNKDEDYWSF